VGTDVGLFRGQAARSDDITLICLKYEGRSLDYQIGWGIHLELSCSTQDFD